MFFSRFFSHWVFFVVLVYMPPLLLKNPNRRQVLYSINVLAHLIVQEAGYQHRNVVPVVHWYVVHIKVVSGVTHKLRFQCYEREYLTPFHFILFLLRYGF
jgi:hypothetical protein